jgi:hypothetical protein
MKKQVALINWGIRVTDALKSCILGLVCCALAVAMAPAQTISGRIAGVITDQAGGVVPKAAITVTSEETGAMRRAKANEDGFYVAPELPVGYYTLKVEGGGFAPATLTRVKVDVGAETRMNVKLALQATQVAVSVSVATPILQSDSALAEVIDNKQVDALPLNGRDFRRLTTIVLGSAPRSQRGALG